MDASMLSEILADLRAGDATRDDQRHAADVVELRGKRLASVASVEVDWRTGVVSSYEAMVAISTILART